MPIKKTIVIAMKWCGLIAFTDIGNCIRPLIIDLVSDIRKGGKWIVHQTCTAQMLPEKQMRWPETVKRNLCHFGYRFIRSTSYIRNLSDCECFVVFFFAFEDDFWLNHIRNKGYRIHSSPSSIEMCHFIGKVWNISVRLANERKTTTIFFLTGVISAPARHTWNLSS